MGGSKTQESGKVISSSGDKKSVVVRFLSYLLLVTPFILAYLSWVYFPFLVDYVMRYGFRYTPVFLPTHWLWYAITGFFYTWYTFLAIGIGGTFVVAAWLWKRKGVPKNEKEFPMVSFIVPAHDEEKQISRCITSLFECATAYRGFCEIIVVDDGSHDHTYEIAWATIETKQRRWPQVRAKVVRHSVNLGKVEAVRTGVNKAMGSVIAVVDADSWWEPSALTELINCMNYDGRVAVTGYVHPSNGKNDSGLYVILQQLEYSQGLGIFRCAQALGNAVLVIPGPMGTYEADVLRGILNEKGTQTITEDLEITLELQKMNHRVGYVDKARGSTIAPTSFKDFWTQRIRWFIGWLHNILGVHKDLLYSRRWITPLLWYYLFLGYVGAAIELTAVFSIPVLFLLSPDKTCFLVNLLLFLSYAVVIGIIVQSIALKFAYNHYNHKRLLLYTPLYSILRVINICARFTCMIDYALGKRGVWHKA